MNGHIAAEAAISLRQFQARIAAADHDQMLRQIVELQRLDMRERLGRLQTGNVRKGRMRSDIEKDLVGREHARSSVIQDHFERFRRYETPVAHDQFGTARFVILQVLGNLPLNHLALAPANRRHVDGDSDRSSCRTSAP